MAMSETGTSGILALGQMLGMIVLLEVLVQAFTVRQTVQKPFYIYSSSQLNLTGTTTLFSTSTGGKLESMRIVTSQNDFSLILVIDGNQTVIPSSAIMNGAVPMPGISYVPTQDTTTFVIALDNIEFSNSLQVVIQPATTLTIYSITAKGYTLEQVTRFGLALG